MQSIHITSVLAAMAMALALNTAQAKKNCDKQDVLDIASSGAGGSGTLCMTHGGLKADIKITGLVADDAYTVWWVYFDDPSLCEVPDMCGEGDLAPSAAGGGTPLGVFGRLGSAVAPGNGKVHLRDEIRGMEPSSGSQIWLLALGHGPADYADGRQLARQLLTPEDPAAGSPHLGNDVDGARFIPVALTVHQVD